MFCKAVMEGCWIVVDLVPAGGLLPICEFGTSKASTRGIKAFLIPDTSGLTTLLTSDTSPSRIDFNPSPLASASIPRPRSSKTWSNSPAKVEMAKAWSCAGFGLGDCEVGAGGLWKAGDEMRGSKWADRLVRRTDRGRCSERRMARWRWGLSAVALSSLE